MVQTFIVFKINGYIYIYICLPCQVLPNPNSTISQHAAKAAFCVY